MTSYEKARQTLTNFFVLPGGGDAELPASALLTILEAKRDAVENGDQRFEHLLLDVGRYCDERHDDPTGWGGVAQRNFLRLVALLQKVDETSKHINKLAFFAKGLPDTGILAGILATWFELATIRADLFREIFVDRLLSSDILGRMGRKRLVTLIEGLERLDKGKGSLSDIQRQMEAVEREEQFLVKLVTTIQDVIGNRYGWVAGIGERDTIKRMVSIELRHRRFLTGEIPDKLFDVGLRLAKTSLMYINTLLPIIVSNGDVRLREEFIRDSGLDRLLVEELETHWCERENFSQKMLASILDKG